MSWFPCCCAPRPSSSIGSSSSSLQSSSSSRSSSSSSSGGTIPDGCPDSLYLQTDSHLLWGSLTRRQEHPAAASTIASASSEPDFPSTSSNSWNILKQFRVNPLYLPRIDLTNVFTPSLDTIGSFASASSSFKLALYDFDGMTISHEMDLCLISNQFSTSDTSGGFWTRSGELRWPGLSVYVEITAYNPGTEVATIEFTQYFAGTENWAGGGGPEGFSTTTTTVNWNACDVLRMEITIGATASADAGHPISQASLLNELQMDVSYAAPPP